MWLFIFALGLVVLFASMFFALFRGMRSTVPAIGRGSVISIDLARPYAEDPLYARGPFIDTEDVTFRELLYGIRAAKDDARIDHLFLHVRGTTLGWANTFELRSQLVDFQSNGKPVIAFIEYAGNRDYVLASAADEVYLHPRSAIDLRGVRAELLFIKSTLEKLGVEAEFERFGAYKSSPEMFLRESMSDEARVAITGVVDTIHAALVDAVAEGRDLPRDDVEALVAQGPFTAEQAKKFGLVDDLKYIDEVRRGMSSQNSEGDDEPSFIAVANYRQAVGTASGFTTKGRIALIYGVGAIVGGGSGEDAVFGRGDGLRHDCEGVQDRARGRLRRCRRVPHRQPRGKRRGVRRDLARGEAHQRRKTHGRLDGERSGLRWVLDRDGVGHHRRRADDAHRLDWHLRGQVQHVGLIREAPASVETVSPALRTQTFSATTAASPTKSALASGT